MITAMNGLPWWFFDKAEGALAGKRLTAIDPDGTIGRAIPTSRAIGCVVYMACAVDSPGVIHMHAGRRMIIGAAGGSSDGIIMNIFANYDWQIGWDTIYKPEDTGVDSALARSDRRGRNKRDESV